MDTVLLQDHVRALVMKISIITGWKLPDVKEYYNVFKDQLQKMLLESYPTMNVDEIEYAMRKYGTKVKDWGKAMNLSLIDEALGAYMFDRRQVSEYEEKSKKESYQQFPAGETDWSDYWKKLKEDPDKAIPVAIYAWLEKQGKIDLSNDDKKELMERAKSRMVGDLQDKVSKGETKFKKDLEALKGEAIPHEFQTRIINRAKILAVKAELNNQKTITE